MSLNLGFPSGYAPAPLVASVVLLIQQMVTTVIHKTAHKRLKQNGGYDNVQNLIFNDSVYNLIILMANPEPCF